MKFPAEFLKNNPVFWSRLGFCYDPPLKNKSGEPLVFTENLTKDGDRHRAFSKKGVKIHTSILHSGWVGVNEYDYRLTDKVLDEVFRNNEDIYYIPRIKLNVPIDWCRENPEEVFVYDEGPRDREEIRSLVGTLRQDYIGYDSPKGYYQAGDYKDTRPNVGGVIARQSFSSKVWQRDAGVALEKLIDRLEGGKYGDRIIGYHIAYGVSGETVSWGRVSGRYGDHGIANRRAFYDFGLKKYGSKEALCEAWCQKDITGESVVIPSMDERAGKTFDITEFMRGRACDTVSVDYDEFTSQVNADALLHFAKIVKEKTGKLAGCFYGYFMHIDNAAYAGHIAIEKLLDSPYIDFFAAPKSYYRCGPGEPGGELCPSLSINRKKLWVDEMDNRTYLAGKEEIPENSDGESKIDTDSWLSKNAGESISVMLREFSKNLSRDSGFWWMDLGGGWYDSDFLLSTVGKCVDLNRKIREKTHESIADILIVVDENSAKYTRANKTLREGFMEDFIMETAMSGALADVYRLSDLSEISLKKYKLVVFAYTVYIEPEYFEKVRGRMREDVTVMFNFLAGAWNKSGFDISNTEKLTGYKITPTEPCGSYDIPMINAEKTPHTRDNIILNTTPYLSHKEIRETARNAGCHIYTDAEGITLYGDSRFLGVFNDRAVKAELAFDTENSFCEITENKKYERTSKIELALSEKSCRMFIKIN